MLISQVVRAPHRYLKKLASRSPGELFREASRRARIAAPLERYLGGGRALPPHAVSFWVTRRCNFRCGMCWVESSRRREGESYLGAGNELTLAELKAVVDDLLRWRPRLGITGGEPFLRGDTLDFIAYIKSRRLRCGANTNGSFLRRDAEALVETGLDSLMVSVDGPPDIHDGQRGSPGSFLQIKEGLDLLREARARARAGAPYVKITCTITAANVASLSSLPALLADSPPDELTFQHLWYTDPETADAQRRLFSRLFGQDTTYLQGFISPALPPLDVDALRRQREAIINRSWPFTVNFYPDLDASELAAFYENPGRRFRRRCFSRWLRLDVWPEGTVTPCLGLAVGNVRRTPLSEIWNGAPFRRFRTQLASRRLFPGCTRCCGLFSD